ncbi:BRO family protein [Gordonia rubripertincta]|uniref:BRO family protein n=1 Tax=Gordonia rubripertincta TaxID=36822 RepID=UPI0015F9BB95|nr:phage antirepressor KilAC domain-containing protein [Gordonia rubripertincta]QMU22536.1 phage antirepressor KilAC domain-containing protein [Gordonia rubripertincta]
MAAALAPFDYQGQTVRTVVIDGEPWFVAADVARILGYRMASDMTRRLDDEDRGTRSVRTPSGEQDMTVVNEPGLYQAVLGAQSAGAREFKRWVTHTVLPEIRKTGSYNVTPALEGPELLARAVLEAQQMLAAKDERIAELEPKAEVADRILDADGDLSVADAAKSLSRAGVKVGQNRLFTLLANQYGWIYRAADNRWRVKQAAIETGWMQVIPQSHYHPRTGVLVLDPPQPRITPKGLQRILVDHGGHPALDMKGVTA